MSSEVACSHLDQVVVLELPAQVAGCEECLKIGSEWMHQRMCQSCGKVGCCDSSPNRHASRHAAEEGHPRPLTGAYYFVPAADSLRRFIGDEDIARDLRDGADR